VDWTTRKAAANTSRRVRSFAKFIMYSS